MKNLSPVFIGAGTALVVSIAVWYFASKKLKEELGLGGQQLEADLGAGATALRAEFARKSTELERRIRATITDQLAREKLAILRQVQTLIAAAGGAVS